jgi:hypothetical protein
MFIYLFITGEWQGKIKDEGDIKANTPRCVELTPINVTAPKDLPAEMIEARVYFGTLERTGTCPRDPTPEQTMLQFAREANLDDRWEVDRSWEGTAKSPPIVVAKRSEVQEFRQALPDGVSFFIADHYEAGRYVNQHRIKCKGGESPEEQAMIVSNAFTKPMKITEWVEEMDGVPESYLLATLPASRGIRASAFSPFANLLGFRALRPCG